jgi:hypothetical protein
MRKGSGFWNNLDYIFFDFTDVEVKHSMASVMNEIGFFVDDFEEKSGGIKSRFF